MTIPDTTAADRAARKRSARADTWQYDPQLEALDTMKRTDSARYAAMSPNLKLALGFYARGKAAAEAEGVDTDPPTAA